MKGVDHYGHNRHPVGQESLRFSSYGSKTYQLTFKTLVHNPNTGQVQYSDVHCFHISGIWILRVYKPMLPCIGHDKALCRCRAGRTGAYRENIFVSCTPEQKNGGSENLSQRTFCRSFISVVKTVLINNCF